MSEPPRVRFFCGKPSLIHLSFCALCHNWTQSQTQLMAPWGPDFLIWFWKKGCSKIFAKIEKYKARIVPLRSTSALKQARKLLVQLHCHYVHGSVILSFSCPFSEHLEVFSCSWSSYWQPACENFFNVAKKA